jgi:hypothetical protein
MRYLTAISLALIVLMALACTAEPATPDVPLLDEETVAGITHGFVTEGAQHSYRLADCLGLSGHDDGFQAEYLGKDIWVVKLVGFERLCTFTVHDKEARVIVSQQYKATD